MIWSDKRFILHNGHYVPEDLVEGEDFVVVTDHSRAPLEIEPERIEARSRMINGTSRSYHTADKTRLVTSWSLLPSRISVEPIVFDQVTGEKIAGGCSHVVDSGTAATDIKQWYDTHPGPFYVYLSFDHGSETDTLETYDAELFMYFDSASFTLEKRGLYDMWNVSVSLGEV